jgi:pyrroline-5-carboxylate reductase
MDIGNSIAILGGGNIGVSIANGLAGSGLYSPENIIITRKKTNLLKNLSSKGFKVQSDNLDAVRKAGVLIVAVRPQQINDLLDEIKDELNGEKNILISVVSGASIHDILNRIDKNIPVIRAMPNIE